MAVATPVLENGTQEYEDEMHNALIKERYAKLINPENKLNDLRGDDFGYNRAENTVPVMDQPAAPVYEQPLAAPAEQPAAQAYVQPNFNAYNAEPYLAPSGRADGEIFRADSEINRRLRAAQSQPELNVEQPANEEDENEDLRPTPTTIQYKTEGVKKTCEEGATVTTHNSKHFSLSKHDKIVIAAVVVVIVALFVLIIVNSAIISGINNELGSLQSTLNTARGAYSSISDQISDYTANLEDTVNALAERLGMVK